MGNAARTETATDRALRLLESDMAAVLDASPEPTLVRGLDRLVARYLDIPRAELAKAIGQAELTDWSGCYGRGSKRAMRRITSVLRGALGIFDAIPSREEREAA